MGKMMKWQNHGEGKGGERGVFNLFDPGARERDTVRMATQPFGDFALQLHPRDTVAVLKRLLPAGTSLAREAGVVTASVDIHPGHKIALRAVAVGEPVLKYGQIIGFAKSPIAPGDHVHTHNLGVHDFARDYQFGADLHPVSYYPPS